MQPRDLMYALHIVLLHLHYNRLAQNFFVHIWDHTTPIMFFSWYHSHLFTTQAIDVLPQAHVLLAIASDCALF